MSGGRTTIEVAPEADGALAAWCRDLPALVDAAGTEDILHRGRNLLVRCASPAGTVVAKRFGLAWWQRLVYAVRSTKARRSFDNARLLDAHGFATPRPLAVVERRLAGLPVEAWYVCEWIPGADLVRAYIRNRRTDVEPMRGLGAELARLHEAGLLHRDLTPGNVLIVRDGGGWRYPLVDLNRLARRRPSPAAGIANLAQLELQGPAADALLDGYCARRGLDRDRTGRRYERALRRRWRSRRWRNATRRWRHLDFLPKK